MKLKKALKTLIDSADGRLVINEKYSLFYDGNYFTLVNRSGGIGGDAKTIIKYLAK